MKPLTKKVIISTLVAVFLWFSLSEHGGFVQRSLSYVYDLEYHLAEASERQDYAVDTAGQYWIPMGELLPIEGDYQIIAFGGTGCYPAEVDDGDILYIVVEITEISKDGPDACAPEGYVHNHKVVSVPEGAMHSAAVMQLNPLSERGYVCEAGVHNCPIIVH
jgi:hypothetical protein